MMAKSIDKFTNMKLIFSIIFIFSFNTVSFCQHFDTVSVLKRAKLTVITDLNNKIFNLPNIDSCLSKFRCNFIKCDDVNNFYFISIRIENITFVKNYFFHSILLKESADQDLDESMYEKLYLNKYNDTLFNNIDSLESKMGSDYIHNKTLVTCNFIIGYDEDRDVFYQLKGYKKSDFLALISLFLANPSNYLFFNYKSILKNEEEIHYMNDLFIENSKNIVRKIHVEGLDWEKLCTIFFSKNFIDLPPDCCFWDLRQPR